jgi:regulation of enolase protein 1 (concanavalin A-like superfamily)
MNFENFKWVNESKAEYKDGVLTVYAPSQTDYFNSPVKENGAFPEPVANASLYYTELTGDFVFKTKVKLEFKNFYDAAALLVYENENVWAKLALENSDLPCRKPAVVSVVTNRISDDCNGPVMDGNSVWLQISRVDDCFAFHYSVDGKEYQMVRVFTLPVGKTVKVGFEAQAPMGEGGNRYYSEITIENKRVKNIRAGY